MVVLALINLGKDIGERLALNLACRLQLNEKGNIITIVNQNYSPVTFTVSV